MNDQPEELDFEERRKRLEQLFAAEPHLSPTMKARQLYDPAEAQPNGHHSLLNGFAPTPELNATPGPAPQAAVHMSPAAPSVADFDSVGPDGMLSLTAARQELRRRASPEGIEESGDRTPDDLDTLRDDLLARWRRDIYSDR